MKKNNISVVGAGLVGSLLSIFLAKRGHAVSVYERRPDMRSANISAGRSINLALSDRGWRGLEGAGVDAQVRDIGIAMKGRSIHNSDGKIVFQPYGQEHQANYSVSRGGLNSLLMDEAEKVGAKFYFNEKCTHFNLDSGEISFENYETKKASHIKSDRCFGTDGNFSATRFAMQTSSDRFNFSQDFLDHGYKELTIVPKDGGEFAMDPNTLHIWPRGQFMLIALPNPDKTFTCTLFFPLEGEFSFESIDTPKKMHEFFNKTFPDAVPLMPNLEKDFFENPTSSLVTIRCYPWHHSDKLLLLGDAAHGVVPFFGQGMNCGFEDCVVLDKMMDQYGEDWNSLFSNFGSHRKPDADAIAHLAVENYYEMRDKVADPKFLLQKKIEAHFSSKHPDKWTPLYAMVTYRSDMRYSEALKEGLRQEEIMKKIMRLPNLEEKWNSDEIENAMLELL